MQNLSLFFFRLAPTALNNEYIRQAFTHYKERLAEGAFQAENQQRMKQAEDRAILKMESMKVTHTKHLFIRYLTFIKKKREKQPLKENNDSISGLRITK